MAEPATASSSVTNTVVLMQSISVVGFKNLRGLSGAGDAAPSGIEKGLKSVGLDSSNKGGIRAPALRYREHRVEMEPRRPPGFDFHYRYQIGRFRQTFRPVVWGGPDMLEPVSSVKLGTEPRP